MLKHMCVILFCVAALAMAGPVQATVAGFKAGSDLSGSVQATGGGFKVCNDLDGSFQAVGGGFKVGRIGTE